MESKKIFFSYSRSDSEFSRKLALELKDAGLNVWLDQINISPGKAWDAEIQNALMSSDVVIVTLSPNSVASNNVMDEVSWALDKGKRVIPIVISECEIPFRLKRLQYIDFENNYQKGVIELLASLHPRTEIVTEKNEVEREVPQINGGNPGKSKKPKGCTFTFSFSILATLVLVCCVYLLTSKIPLSETPSWRKPMDESPAKEEPVDDVPKKDEKYNGEKKPATTSVPPLITPKPSTPEKKKLVARINIPEKSPENIPEKSPENFPLKPSQHSPVENQRIEPATKKVRPISSTTFKSLLEKVASGSIKAEDFDIYLINGTKTAVVVNNKVTMSFKEFCEEIDGKKIRIRDVKLILEENNQENIQRIEVYYTNKGFLKNIF